MSRLDLADGLRMLEQSKSGETFGHPEHLAFAWAVLDEAEDVEDAVRVVSMTIRHVATLAGNPDKFHVTITIFWVRILEHVRSTHRGLTSLDEAIRVFPGLSDPGLHSRHWSNIGDERARTGWLEPDLEPMP